MPTERLTIENFKGISHLELELKPFTVLIGPQSVGKSITAKLLYFFKTLPLEVFEAAIRVKSDDPPTSLNSWLSGRFDRLLPRPNRTTGNSAIQYARGDSTISLQNNGDDSSPWQIKLPDFLQSEFSKIRSEYSKLAKNEESLGSFSDLASLRTSLLRDAFLKDFHDCMGERSTTLVWFIPAGRAFYAQVEKDPVSYFESANLDPFVALFGKFLAFLKDPVHFPPPKSSASATLAAELTERLLSGKYERVGQKDFINVNDGRRLPPALWSSGQQESLPLVLHLRRWAEGSLQTGRGIGLFIEEPEAHLFPTSQRLMVELISLAFNSAPEGTNIFITTHSPYVLSTLNVLLKAGQLFQKTPGVANPALIARTVPRLEALTPGSVGAYYMDQKECHTIIDAETGLIDGRAIDDVSGELAEQFDALSEVT